MGLSSGDVTADSASALVSSAMTADTPGTAVLIDPISKTAVSHIKVVDFLFRALLSQSCLTLFNTKSFNYGKTAIFAGKCLDYNITIKLTYAT